MPFTCFALRPYGLWKIFATRKEARTRLYSSGRAAVKSSYPEAIAKKYYILGHSEGGSLALIHAAQHPDGLLKVITLSANTEYEPCITPGIESVRKQYEKPNSKLKQALQKYHGTHCDDVFYAWCNTWTATSFQSWNIKAELSRIQVLAFHGRNDQYTSLLQIENIKQLVPAKKEVHILNQCSHHPHFDYPVEVLAFIRNFIEQK